MLLLNILWDDWPIFYDFRFKWTATAGIRIHLTKALWSQLGNFKKAIWHFRRTICNEILFSILKKRQRNLWNTSDCFRPSCINRASVFEGHKRFKESRASVRDVESCGRSKKVNTPELIGKRVWVRVNMLRF